VNDLEAELREAMMAATSGARPPDDLIERLRRKRRRSRARRLAASAAGAAIVVAAVPVGLTLLRAHGRGESAAGSTTASPKPKQTQPSPRPGKPPPRGWVRHRDGAGDYIDVPAAWHVSSVSSLIEPTVRWVIGTGPVPGGGSCAPTAALRRLPADGALFQVIEYSNLGEPYSFPPRHGRLALGPIGGPFECWGVKTHLAVFQDGGRYFQVQTVFGTRAPASLRAEVVRALKTMHIAPLPPAKRPAGLCRAGEWTYCPQATWVYRVLNEARVVSLGNQGTRAIVAQAGRASFAVRTTKPRGRLPGARCRSVSGTEVCRVRNGLVCRVRGLWLWIEPASSAYSTPPIRPGLPSRPALRRLVAAARAVPRS